MLDGTKKILIVEDDEKTLQLYKDLFAFKKETKMANFLYARNVKECLELLEKEKPTLMLLDLGLEDKVPPPGFKILQDYKNKLKIIVISGYHENKQQSLDDGAVAFLGKPVQIKDLVRLMIEYA